MNDLDDILAAFDPSHPVGHLIDTRPIEIFALGTWGDNPQTLSILMYTNGFELCKFNKKTNSSVSIGQARFKSIRGAIRWATQAHACGYRFTRRRARGQVHWNP